MVQDNSFIEIADGLENIQLDLLLVQAAFLAFQGSFHDGPSSVPYPPTEIAEYFISHFLASDPDKKISAAVDFILKIRDESALTISKD